MHILMLFTYIAALRCIIFYMELSRIDIQTIPSLDAQIRFYILGLSFINVHINILLFVPVLLTSGKDVFV